MVSSKSRIGVGVLLAALVYAVVGVAPGWAQVEQRPELLGHQLYRAEFHSHTELSDGLGTPQEAYEWVRSQSNADFFSLAEHDVAFDLRNGDAYTEDWRTAASQEWRRYRQGVQDYNAAQSELVLGSGYEMTWYDGTGHLNVFNTDWLLTANSPKGGGWGTGAIMNDLPTVYARIAQDPGALAQFNHPGATGWGDFYDFNHLTPQADRHVTMFEYKTTDYHSQWVMALDNGWHLSPTYSGDEHRRAWVTGNPAITGVWTDDHSPEGLYDAMRERRTFASFDDNAELKFSANGQIMGSILPADTTELALEVATADPDGEKAATITVYGNRGEVLHTATDTDELNLTLPSRDGDYVWVQVTQADGDAIISAPIWVGKQVRDANYAPELSVSELPDNIQHGQRVELPQVSATDDSGQAPRVEVTVHTAQGEIPVTDGSFVAEGYADHFVVVKAIDAQGSTSVDLSRMTVSRDSLDADAVFRHGTGPVSVGAQPGSAGLTALTDQQITSSVAQVLPSGATDWSQAVTVPVSRTNLFERDQVAIEADNYQDSITGHTLRSHEYDVTGLAPGRYQYRLGVSETGPFTVGQGEFLVGGHENEPLYVLADLQVPGSTPEDWELFNRTLTQVREQRPGGSHLLQLGDLVDNGGRAAYWQQTQEQIWGPLDLQYAGMAGNHESYGDKELNDLLSTERNVIFNSHVNQPNNGVVGESNYSYDRGDIHVSVLNSNYSLAEQIAWLVQDVRATDKPWKVVTGHFSYYGGSHADDAGMLAARNVVSQTLEQLGVQLYLGGHDHVYKRSTIAGGELVPAEGATVTGGTTYVTLGSAGPKFYENQAFWWDDVVDDRDIQMGSVLEVTEQGLQLSTYTIDGDVVDEFTIAAVEGDWRVSSLDMTATEIKGFGVLSHPGARDSITVTVATYDHDQTTLLGSRTVEVDLDHRGTEQYVAFDQALPASPQNAVKVFVWDSPATAVPLTPAWLVRAGFTGGGTAEDPFQIRTWQDIEAISDAPGAHYQLMNDLELDDTPRTPIGAQVPFTGVFDGAGHIIKGFVPNPDQGVGLFSSNGGTIRNLAVVDADIESSRGTAGILVDHNTGTVERSWTSGRIVGESRVGGLVGDNEGVVRDYYSTADVRSLNTEAGGVVAVALGGSLTERVYATGNVTSDVRNVGGVVGYGYNETEINDSLSLNKSVTAPQWAHPVLGRVLSGNVATLTGLYAWQDGFVATSALNEEPSTSNLYGAPVAAADLEGAGFYADTLGWDMEQVWQYDEELGRPVLRVVSENAATGGPELPVNEDGKIEIATPADLALVTRHPEADFVLTADLDLSGVDDFQSLGGSVPFRGEFDGAGHTISNLTSPTGGLINLNLGYVHDLGIVDATVSRDGSNAGLVVNHNHGVIERVYGTGTVTAASRVGGLVGESTGELRDAYAVVDVSTPGTEAGGVLGLGMPASTTERIYGAGTVRSETRNVGGVVGYGYTGTTISDSMALTSSVTAPDWAHRFLGRVLSGNTATLANNWGIETAVVEVPTQTADPSPTNLMGGTATVRQARDPQFWTETLGWDLEQVWQWHDDAGRPILRSVPEEYTGEPVPPVERPDLPRDTDGAYLIGSPADLAVINEFPNEDYRLSADLDLSGESVRIAPAAGFSGDFDGAGHQITGYSSTAGGLFSLNTGTVHDVALVDASVTNTKANVGLLVDTNRGTVERSWSSGSISGGSTVGGLVGYSYGTVRDSYSTASVKATAGRQAGGLIGITGRGSTTERVYAAGEVEVVGNMNAGGVSGYSYATTTIDAAVALNPSVKASSYGNRVVARVLAGEEATLSNLYALDSVAADATTVEPDASDIGGATATREELGELLPGLGWDFSEVWQWDADLQRPTLSDTPEEQA
ncbi:metallophosphoesterase [Parenemella sanctibonifatiensis]|uniref:metallophosphoesterase n=1 Tax=Parenemella sanctibonifatiensis TaxID=2016505 RepID=UPI0011866CEE|nr:metallophosphoesterase [Parenemella sanctibonifatiensis]